MRLFAMLTAVACSAAPTAVQGPPASSAHPKLVVLVVIDQWPEWAFEAKRPAMHDGGFDRLLAEGDWHIGRHPSAATLTAPGHALIGTGEPTWKSGILSNSWYHRDADKMLEAAEQDDGSVGPQWLRVPGLGDAVATSTGKAFSVSLKSRAAVLMLGHAGTPIWYDPKQVAFTTTTDLGWLAEWNRAHPVAAHLHDVWTALPGLPGRDDRPGEPGEKGFGGTFPHDPQATKSAAEAIDAMPIGNDLVLDVALATIDNAHLGTHAAPDLLAISLSAHDYVGHGWGQESWEMWDLEHRLDARLKAVLAALDAKVGAGNWAMIVTSDHGGMPTPIAGDITYEQLVEAANRAAIAELGDGQWVAAAKYPTMWLSKSARAQPTKDLNVAIKKMIFALRSFPGLARVERTDSLAGDCDRKTGDARTMCLGLDAERSGEIAFYPRPGWLIHDADEPMAAAHGSLHDYDHLVPVIVLAPGRTTHAPLAHPDATVIDMAQIAKILAGWLDVPPPSELPREPPRD